MKHWMTLITAMIFAFVFAIQASAAELTVSAAASLKEAFTAVKAAFEKQHPDTAVLLSFAGSNTCLRQIETGAPVDVFASADQETMNKAEAAKLILPATRRDFARNDLVLIVPSDSNIQKAPFAEAVNGLVKDEVRRIAVGNPESVPAGRYAKAALTSCGKWEVLQHKYIFGQNVRQTLSYATQGEVDAALVYRTDALKGQDSVRIIAVAEGHNPILYPIAVCNTGKNAPAGEQFVMFVMSEQGQMILAQYGFSRP
jgi:molybdate transport system substrate-binding protein